MRRTAQLCVDALDEALARFGRPEIFNTDQGSQFTSAAFIGRLASTGIQISMDGCGLWMDNVFIERLCRSLKYEDVYLKGYADRCEARAGIASSIGFCNPRRRHSSLGCLWSIDYAVTGTQPIPATCILPPRSGRSKRGLGNSPEASSPEQRPALPAPCERRLKKRADRNGGTGSEGAEQRNNQEQEDRTPELQLSQPKTSPAHQTGASPRVSASLGGDDG